MNYVTLNALGNTEMGSEEILHTGLSGNDKTSCAIGVAPTPNTSNETKQGERFLGY